MAMIAISLTGGRTAGPEFTVDLADAVLVIAPEGGIGLAALPINAEIRIGPARFMCQVPLHDAIYATATVSLNVVAAGETAPSILVAGVAPESATVTYPTAGGPVTMPLAIGTPVTLTGFQG